MAKFALREERRMLANHRKVLQKEQRRRNRRCLLWIDPQVACEVSGGSACPGGSKERCRCATETERVTCPFWSGRGRGRPNRTGIDWSEPDARSKWRKMVLKERPEQAAKWKKRLPRWRRLRRRAEEERASGNEEMARRFEEASERAKREGLEDLMRSKVKA